MTIFQPRNSQQILRSLLGRVLNRTELSDVNVGSTLYTLMQTVAIELANVETRLNNVRNGYSIQSASGAELDARVAELPPGTIFRKKSGYAGAAVLTINRDDSSAELIIPVGSVVQSSVSGVEYTTVEQITMAIGVATLENQFIIAKTPGTTGNADVGDIINIIRMPGVSSVTNTGAITSGVNEETDGALRARALKFVKSLGKCQRNSLEYLGESFVAEDGQTAKFSRIYEDINKPGYCELIVDDGQGFVNQDTVGTTSNGTVGANGQLYIWHESPATQELKCGVNFTILRDGDQIIFDQSQYKSVPERGLIYFNEGVLQEGDEWSVNNYRIYKGFIADLQDEIEGYNNLSQLSIPGYRAAGTRVKVDIPALQNLSFKIEVAVNPGLNINNTRNAIRLIAINYINNLPIGEPLIVTKLIQTIQNSGLIISCKILDNNNNVLTDTYPNTLKTVLRTNNNLITVS